MADETNMCEECEDVKMASTAVVDERQKSQLEKRNLKTISPISREEEKTWQTQ